MLLFDLSDTSVKMFKLSRRLLGGRAITACAVGALGEGLIENYMVVNPDKLTERIKTLLQKSSLKPASGEECAFILQDERTFSLRLKIPRIKDSRTIKEMVEKQAAAVLSETFASQANAFRILTSSGESREIQFAAVDQKLLSIYLDLFNALALKPVLAAPESWAIFTLFSSQINEGETILSLDVGPETTDVVILDRGGVVQTFTEPVENPQLTAEIIKLLPFIKKKWGRDPQRIFLGGGGAPSLNRKVFAEKTKRPVLSAEEILKTYPLPVKADFGKASRLDFLGLFGLALVARQKEPLNLIH